MYLTGCLDDSQEIAVNNDSAFIPVTIQPMIPFSVRTLNLLSFSGLFFLRMRSSSKKTESVLIQELEYLKVEPSFNSLLNLIL